MNPHYEKPMLENKCILILGNEYRLSIIKNNDGNYEAYLSDVNSNFTSEKTFYSYEDIGRDVLTWIKEMNAYNDPELRAFEELKRWDGVVRI